jgi:cytoskeletal protein CcmA (bactofilin family)
VLVVGGLIAGPVGAAGVPSRGGDRPISINSGVVIAQGETVKGPVISIDGPATINGVVKGDVYVGRGSLRINGQVTGNALVVDGDATVTGAVSGDVVAVFGRVIVRSGASVDGDVVSRRAPQVASGTVSGDVKRFNVSGILRGFLITFLLVLWLAVTVSVAIVGLLFVLLFSRAADATVAAGRRVWVSLGWGALIGIVGPVVAVLVLVTIVGIPLGLGVLSALNALSVLGYIVASLSLGRVMIKGTSKGARIGAFFAGFGILRALALLPAIGFIVWFVACLYGLGALTVAAWRAGHQQSAPPHDTVPSPAVEPGAVASGTDTDTSA